MRRHSDSPQCLTCKRPVDSYTVSRNIFQRSIDVFVYCHGQTAQGYISDEMTIHLRKPTSDLIREMRFFSPPLPPPIIDRDPGDEDPAG